MAEYKGDTLELLRDPVYQDILTTLDMQLDYIDLPTYQDHSIIEKSLQRAKEKFGLEVMNDLIDELELYRYGWKKERIDDDI